MSLTITSVNSPTSCAHRLIVVDQEGTSRQFSTTLQDIDDLLARFDTPADAYKALVMLWAAYRRAQGRTITGVIIA